jgi:hypothetical protein
MCELASANWLEIGYKFDTKFRGTDRDMARYLWDNMLANRYGTIYPIDLPRIPHDPSPRCSDPQLPSL